MFDLNQLLSSHQTARYNTQHAASRSERETYQGLADYYAQCISRFREDKNLPAYRWS